MSANKDYKGDKSLATPETMKLSGEKLRFVAEPEHVFKHTKVEYVGKFFDDTEAPHYNK